MGVEFWIECKRTTGWAVKFQPTQVSWIEDRVRAGGNVWIAVRRQNESSGADELYLYRGAKVRGLAQYGIKNIAACSVWEGGSSKWNYAEVLNKITNASFTACFKALSPSLRSAIPA